MKANEAPEKIWVRPKTFIGPWPPYVDENAKYGGIEYILADAFIEKACDAYCEVCGHYAHTVPYEICRHDCHYYDDFKKLLKGE